MTPGEFWQLLSDCPCGLPCWCSCGARGALPPVGQAVRAGLGGYSSRPQPLEGLTGAAILATARASANRAGRGANFDRGSDGK